MVDFCGKNQCWRSEGILGGQSKEEVKCAALDVGASV